jgi:hypothetical protein
MMQITVAGQTQEITTAAELEKILGTLTMFGLGYNDEKQLVKIEGLRCAPDAPKPTDFEATILINGEDPEEEDQAIIAEAMESSTMYGIMFNGHDFDIDDLDDHMGNYQIPSEDI